MAAVTAEDLAFEASLQAAQVSGPDIEPSPVPVTIKKEKMANIPLSDFVDNYQPAKTHSDLIEQVYLAKEHGADAVEADPQVIRQLTLKSGYPSDVGYLWFHDVKVWIPGYMATHGYLLTQTIDERVFGHSKVGVHPIMGSGPQGGAIK